MSRAEWQYSNIEWEVLGILHGLEKFHHHCFAKDVYIITVHKPLVVMVSKNVAALSQQVQYIMLHIQQYNMHILDKPCLALYIADWLSQHNHIENRVLEIASMSIDIHTVSTVVDVPVCMLIEDIRPAVSEDAELQMVQADIIKGWPQI